MEETEAQREKLLAESHTVDPEQSWDLNSHMERNPVGIIHGK